MDVVALIVSIDESVTKLCPPRDYGNDVGGRVVTTGLMSGGVGKSML